MRDYIIEIAEENLNRVKPGAHYLTAACPFHKGGQERRPSFYMSLEDGHWGCHTCGERGPGARSLLQRIGIKGYKLNAVLELAEREAKETRKVREVKRRRKARSDFRAEFTLPESILGTYEWCPMELVRQGFDVEVLKENDIGYDRRRDRITFPIRDAYGNLVAISGRQPDGLQPKYKVYSEELMEAFPGYSSSGVKDHIWGVHDFYPALNRGEGDYLILVEGYKARLWMLQNGWRFTGALMGDQMTAQQERLIRHLGVDTWVLLDNDRYGRRESPKICRRLATGSFRVFECEYPEGHEGDQPDDMSTEQLEEMLATARRVGGRDDRMARGKKSGQESVKRPWKAAWQ